jgi:hypothetical protein
VRVTSAHPGAVVRARRATHGHVILQVGAATREIKDELEPASFWQVAGGVIALPATADERLADEERSAREFEAA